MCQRWSRDRLRTSQGASTSAVTKPPENCSPPSHTATTSSGELIASRLVSTQRTREPMMPDTTRAMTMRSVSSVAMPSVALRRAVSQPPSRTPAATQRPNTWIVTGPSSIVGNGT